MKKTIIETTNAPAPIGPYSQAVVANGMLYISGQIALSASTGELEMNDIASETELVMQNLEAILTKANCTFNNVVKSTVLLSDMAHFAIVNTVYGKRFTQDAPARETFSVLGLPKGVNVEISMIAVL